ncbi:MAG TPA: type II secretion system protein GspG [Gemmataceae bacterium]
MSTIRCPNCRELLPSPKGDDSSPTCPNCGQRLDAQAVSRKGGSIAKILVWVVLGTLLFGCLSCTGFAFVGYYYYGQEVESSKADIARVNVKTILTQACKTYWLDHGGQWPPNLQVLVIGDENGKTYLEDVGALKDPWGNLYQYDPSGPRNSGRKPDIWTSSPKGDVIGNW